MKKKVYKHLELSMVSGICRGSWKISIMNIQNLLRKNGYRLMQKCVYHTVRKVKRFPYGQVFLPKYFQA